MRTRYGQGGQKRTGRLASVQVLGDLEALSWLLDNEASAQVGSPPSMQKGDTEWRLDVLENSKRQPAIIGKPDDFAYQPRRR